MKIFKLTILGSFLLISVIFFNGCDNTIKTNLDNREFAKNMVWGKQISSNPNKIKFKNNTYIVSNKEINSDLVNKKIGIVRDSKNTSLYYWLYTIKNKSTSDGIAIYINQRFYISNIEE